MIRRIVFVAAAALLVAPGVYAQTTKEQYTYRCTGADGKKYYGSAIPQQCIGRPLDLVNKQGRVVKTIDYEAEQKAAKDKELAAEKDKVAAVTSKDTERRHRAMLATYTSEKDIEDMRARALRDNKVQVQEVEGRIDEIKKRRARYAKDLELFEQSGKGATAPARLKEEIINADIDLKAQQSLLDAKKKEVEGINARYDDDKKNYKEAIAAKRTAAPAAAAAPAKK